MAGVAAETSAVMLAYLDEAVRRAQAAGRLKTLSDLMEAVHHGAMERIRPVTMTGLATGTGVMKRLAAPMIGGIGSAMLPTLLVIRAIYVICRWHADIKSQAQQS